jgi:hypothetical protein
MVGLPGHAVVMPGAARSATPVQIRPAPPLILPVGSRRSELHPEARSALTIFTVPATPFRLSPVEPKDPQ